MEFRALREIPYSIFFIQKIMSFTNFQKTIALTSGVLVLSIAIGYVVIAASWTGPSANPPSDNAPAPINVGSDAQTKAGNLTVSALTTSGGKLYLNNSGFEGDIERVDEIIGHNDLQLRDSADETKIDLDVWDTGEIEFYTNSQERMRIEKDGDLHKQGDLYVENGNLQIENGDLHVPDLTHVPDFTGCFLEIDEFGKVKCYTGGGIPGGDVLDTSEVQIARATRTVTSGGPFTTCDSVIIPVPDVEKVIRVYYKAYAAAGSCYGRVIFYINDVEQWRETSGFNGACVEGSYYHHIYSGDTPKTLKICGEARYWGTGTGEIYTLGSLRADITHAFADGNILYWYDQAAIGEMNEAGPHYIGAHPPTSVIISAKDEVDVKWIID
jgi:hypothetical protein